MNLIKLKCFFLATLIVAVIFSIWLLPIRQYWIFVPSVTPEDVLTAIQKPDKHTLAAILSASPTLLANHGSPEQQHDRALKIAQGSDPAFGPHKIVLPFSENDAVQGGSYWQLFYSSLGLAGILLQDYELTGNRQNYLLARDMIYRFVIWEKSVHWPIGYVWNDHALAARILVLSRLWLHYRTDQDYDAGIAKELLQAVERVSTRLAMPQAFTYSTNHGVMQNLALIVASMAFPTLPDAEEWGRIGKQRLTGQMGFYVSPEGIVLEHSPHYHRFGLSLLASAIELYQLSGAGLPSTWATLYRRGQFAETWMLRPDGSLPVFGDTAAGPPPGFQESPSANLLPVHDPLAIRSRINFSLFPISGIGGWLELSTEGRRISQSMASWAYFPGHGHSHADELSIALWREGGPELINSGYWPYDSPERDEAVKWKGGNAPHFAGEQTLMSRQAPQLLAYSELPELLGLVMARNGAKGAVQRQFFQVGKENWIVLDVFQGQDKASRGEIIWRVNGNLEHQTNDNSVATWLGKGSGRLRSAFIGADSIKPCDSQLSFAAFATGLEPVPCVAVESAQTPSAVLSIWSASTPVQQDATERLKFVSAEEWEISGLTDSNWTTLARKGIHLTLIGHDGNTHEATLTAAPDVSAERLKLHQAWVELGKKYPIYEDIDTYRLRITYVCLVLALLQAIFLFVMARLYPSLMNKFVTLSVLAWITLAVYLHAVYFVVS